VGAKVVDTVLDCIPQALDRLNHLLFFLATQINKLVFGTSHHIIDLFAHCMHKIINWTTWLIEEGVENWKAER